MNEYRFLNPALAAVQDNDMDLLKAILANMEGEKCLEIPVEDSRIVDEEEVLGDNHGNTLLHILVKLGSTEAIQYITEKFPHIATTKNLKGQTPLWLACALRKNLPVIESLCKYKKDIDECSNKGVTPLQAVLKSKESARYVELKNDEDKGYQIEVMKILIKHGADVNKYVNNMNSDNCPVLTAVEAGNTEALLFLVNAGAKLDVQKRDNSTPLCVACQCHNSCSLIKELVQLNPSLINVRNCNGYPPLYYAVLYKCENCIDTLLRHNAEDSEYRARILMIKTKIGNFQNFINYFNTGIFPVTDSENGATPLSIACMNGHLDIIKFLIEHESIKDFPVDDNVTHPIFCAIESLNIEVLKCVLSCPHLADESKIKYNCAFKCFHQYHAEVSPVIKLLSEIADAEMIERIEPMLDLLLQHGFNCNATNGSISPLVAILQVKNVNSPQLKMKVLNIVKKLIEHGANVYCISPVTLVTATNFLKEQFEVHEYMRAYIIKLRDEYKIFDALFIAFFNDNDIAAKYLIRYWPHEPIILTLLLIYDHFNYRNPRRFTYWLNYCLPYGWQNADEILRRVDQMSTVIRQNDVEREQLLSAYEEKLRQGCPLENLAKLKIRKILYGKMKEHNKYLPDLIDMLTTIPPSMIADLKYD